MSAGSSTDVSAALDARFRRVRDVVCFWAKGGLTFYNYSSGVRITATPSACQILDFFDTWRSTADLIAAFPAFEPASLCAALGDLLDTSLLDTCAPSAAAAPGASIGLPSPNAPCCDGDERDGWAAWNPEAGFFHAATKDVRYGDAFGHSPADLAGQEWRPKQYAEPDARRGAIALPPVRVTGEFPRALLARRTWRRFGDNAIKQVDIATILNLTFAAQRWFEIPGRGRLPFKTSPSGGACHPIEAYLLALRVDGIERGWYHYDPSAHALSLLASAATARADQVVEYLPTQPWYGGAAAIVFMAAVFGRSQARYRYARAYRSVLIEAGHLCQTFCLTSTWLGLAPFCTAALADSRIEATLGLDGVKESVLYAAGVGSRPSEVDCTLYPDDRPMPQPITSEHAAELLDEVG